MNEQDQRPGEWQSPPPPPPTDRRAVGFALGAVGLAVVAAVAVTGLVAGTSHAPQGTNALPWSQSHVESVSNSLGNAQDIAAAAEQVAPGLVDVNTELGLQGASGAGTGIVLSSDGEVLTNNHVVEGATNISVTDIGDGRTYRATVVGYDRSEDVALLKLTDASGLTTAPLGDSDTVSVGDSVAGVGNAGGAGGAPSVAGGQVTAVNQSITASDEGTGSSEQLTGLIQVAANIQPGDSGGPLINAAGKVVGMDTAASANYRLGRQSVASSSGGQGFSIPINQALSIAGNIQQGKASDTVHIGPTAFLGVTVSDTNGSGALIRQLVRNGPAQQAGLTPGDVITAVDGTHIDSATTLTRTLDTYHPNDSTMFTWVDSDNQQHSARVPLATGPIG